MSETGMDRRQFLGGTLALIGASGLVGTQRSVAAAEGEIPPRKFRLGMVTYMMGAKMDIPTLIKTCKETGLEGVELRTTHAHGVEPTISAEKRREVKKQFEDSGIVLTSLGTVCEFHSPKAEELKKHIQTCGEFCRLAKDVGARGVKVRPNNLPKEVPVDTTLEQIARSLAECGKMAEDNGVEIWLEIHGGVTDPARIRKIMDLCNHPKVGACWNSNAADVKDGSVKESFTLVRKYLLSCHITDLFNEKYPWRELFTLMRETKYDRFTLAEISAAPDPVEALKKYREQWLKLSS
jgi:sugar phosphate isomerase/epimerase